MKILASVTLIIEGRALQAELIAPQRIAVREQCAADVIYPLADAFAVLIDNRPDFVANATVLDAMRALLNHHAGESPAHRDAHRL